MVQDRRKDRRFKSSHSARLVVTGTNPIDCQINNYSRGGLSLSIGSAALSAIRAASQADTPDDVQAEVLLGPDTDGTEYRIPVRIRFASEQGVGAIFLRPDARVIRYLSRTSVVERHGPAVNRSFEVLHQAEALLEQALASRYDDFIKILTETFLELEDQASFQVQPELRFGRQAIEADAVDLQRRLLAQIAGNWRQLETVQIGADPSQAESENLELVDQQEFDEWAEVVAIARRLEGRLSQTLFMISQAIAYMIKVPVNNENNPVSPYCVLWALKKSLDGMQLGTKVRNTVYQVFAERVLANMDPTYHQIYELLEQHGFTAREKRPKSQPPSREKMEARPFRPGPRSLIETLSSCAQRKKAPNVSPTRATTSNRTVLHALDDMVQGDHRNLADRIEQSLGGHAGVDGGVELSGESRQIIDATEQLLRTAQQDPRHNATMRRILRQVQLPLAKAAINDPTVLNDTGHPAHQLLNDLDQLALFTPTDPGSVLSKSINERLESVLGSLEVAGGKADLDAVAHQVEELLEEQKSRFTHNLEQVRAASARERQTVSASREIRAFLEQELQGSISILVDQLLQLGWAGLLIQTVSEGEHKAKHLESYKNVLVLLNQALQPGARHAYLKPEKWDRVRQVLLNGLEAYPVYIEQSHRLIEQLAECLKQGSDSFSRYSEQRIGVDKDYFDQLIPMTAGSAAEDDGETGGDARSLRQLEQLRVGDWVAEQRQRGHVRMLNLALYEATDHRYLFVDSYGVKALDCNRRELLQRFQSGQIALMEDAGLPMVERAVEQALRQSFEQLREQSDLDPVTGLMNRRAFRRALEQLLKESRHSADRHSLICLDVDKFTLVNELCGTDGGDQFLVNLGQICQNALGPGNSLSRTGDNEFTILLKQSRLDEGFIFAESLRRAIQQYHFQWGDERISVTVSIGLTEINRDSGSADELTQAAQSACEEAKREGRNRCRCYQHEDVVYTQKKRLIKSVPLIEKALENDQLELFAQLIQPLFVDDGLSEHHEVLLRRIDRQNAPASPDQFIEAAERYERMQAVDRWVVQHFFEWANQTLIGSRGKEMGGFSINLSGQSMANDSFIRFLKKQIEHSVIPPQKLAFEITETAMVSQMGQVTSMMQEIRALGCQFFLDDFGTGYASYSYLKEFPVDVVKIDGIFVKEMHQDPVSYAMVKSITEVAHHMGKRVVAEFVHDEAILTALRVLGVDYAQGFCVGRPAPLKLLAG